MNSNYPTLISIFVCASVVGCASGADGEENAIVGNFGSDKRPDYTAIGPTVNLAARIESAGRAGHVYLSTELKGIEGETLLYKLS